MSRAFIKETDAGDASTVPPERPVSPHRNFVTARGLRQIEDALLRCRESVAKARSADDVSALASAQRDLRYWTARHASAELVPAPNGSTVRFGSTVTLLRGDGRQQTFRITGEDEADPAAGTLSYMSPLARALIGRAEGEDIAFQGDEMTLERIRQSAADTTPDRPADA